MARIDRVFRRGVIWFGSLVALPLAYFALGTIGGSIPANTAWRAPAAGVTVYVESNGVHTGIVVPKVAAGIDWRRLLRGDALADPRFAGYDHVAIGWGERAFYLETPTWSDIRPLTVLRAAFGSDRTVMHVEHLPRPRTGADVRAVTLRPDEYRRLVMFLRRGFADPAAHVRGYNRNDAFYDARGRYSAIHTCNSWTGEALRSAGARIGWWTPFPWSVMAWF